MIGSRQDRRRLSPLGAPSGGGRVWMRRLALATPVVALGWIRGDEPLGFSATLFVLLSVIVTDIGAYASGRDALLLPDTQLQNILRK